MPESNPANGDEQPRRRSKKQAADVVGDLLPDVTRDENAHTWGDRDEGSRDDELLRDVPPHHG